MFTLVGGARHALHDSPPVHQLVIMDRTKLQQGVVGVRLVALQLCEQALGGRLNTRRAGHLVLSCPVSPLQCWAEVCSSGDALN